MSQQKPVKVPVHLVLSTQLCGLILVESEIAHTGRGSPHGELRERRDAFCCLPYCTLRLAALSRSRRRNRKSEFTEQYWDA
ncbi:hypothetical protein TNCV_3481831 [Trichonephila clavipes]|nr:hypothetical protein TNCV_3481831 [Trichonephila clavipes]